MRQCLVFLHAKKNCTPLSGYTIFSTMTVKSYTNCIIYPSYILFMLIIHEGHAHFHIFQTLIFISLNGERQKHSDLKACHMRRCLRTAIKHMRDKLEWRRQMEASANTIVLFFFHYLQYIILSSSFTISFPLFSLLCFINWSSLSQCNVYSFFIASLFQLLFNFFCLHISFLFLCSMAFNKVKHF